MKALSVSIFVTIVLVGTVYSYPPNGPMRKCLLAYQRLNGKLVSASPRKSCRSRLQGQLGSCWASSFSGLLETTLNSKGIEATVSEDYLFAVKFKESIYSYMNGLSTDLEHSLSDGGGFFSSFYYVKQYGYHPSFKFQKNIRNQNIRKEFKSKILKAIQYYRNGSSQQKEAIDKIFEEYIGIIPIDEASFKGVEEIGMEYSEYEQKLFGNLPRFRYSDIQNGQQLPKEETHRIFNKYTEVSRRYTVVSDERSRKNVLAFIKNSVLEGRTVAFYFHLKAEEKGHMVYINSVVLSKKGNILSFNAVNSHRMRENLIFTPSDLNKYDEIGAAALVDNLEDF